MASNSSKKSKSSSGLRVLWIPGRKSHSKGRLSSTNKHISYSPTQKKSEVWTLGGSKAQSELFDLPITPEDEDGASTSSLVTVGAMSSMLVKTNERVNRDNNILSDESNGVLDSVALTPTPVAAISPNLNSPLSELAPSTPSTTAMASPILITTVGILDLHNILNPDDLPKVPLIGEADLSTSAVVLNSSAGTTASITTNASPLAHRRSNNSNNSQSLMNHSPTNTTPQKGIYKNQNNNQDDINSIESISSFKVNQVSPDSPWNEDEPQRTSNEHMLKTKRKKSKKALKESDELDACKINDDKYDPKTVAPYDDNDEKVVKCLYYSLMCCDCTIS